MELRLLEDAPRVVCLDFDDTLCSADGLPLPGARAAVAQVRAWGYRTVVSSARFAPLYGELNARRMDTVRRWLAGNDVEVDEVAYVVPNAAAYVDDLGHRFAGDWPRLVAELTSAHGHRAPGRISVGVECLLDGGAALTGARAGVEALRRAGFEVVVSAGPVVDDQGEDAALERVRRALDDADLPRMRVEVANISSHAYVGARAWRSRADWAATLRELQVALAG